MRTRDVDEATQTDGLQLLLQQFEVLLDGGSVRRRHVGTEHAQKTVQLLRQLQGGGQTHKGSLLL